MLLPDVGDTLNQPWLSVTFQLTLDDTENDVLPADEPTLLLDGLNANVFPPPDELFPACVTVTVLVIVLLLVVIVAVLELVLVFSSNLAVNVPPLLPDVGDTLNQPWLSVTFQLTLDDTENVVLPAEEPTLLLEGLKDNVFDGGGVVLPP